LSGETSEDEGKIARIFQMERRNRGWLWWFWLFFFDNPDNPEKPRQVGILWSTKKDGKLKCNDKLMGSDNPYRPDGSIEGGVAAWYFDGSEMHDQTILGKVTLDLTDTGITTTSPKTAFRRVDGGFEVVVSEDMIFNATLLDSANEFISPWEKEHKVLGFGYEMTGINKMKLDGLVDRRPTEGTCYFQKVYLSTAAPPWYWGIFHFDNGASMTYFNPHILGKSVKKDVSFHDGEKLHKFRGIKVDKTVVGDLPVFNVSSEDERARIEFLVEPYANTVWRFRKRKMGLFPVSFDYGQFPARIPRLRFEEKGTGRVITEEDVGIGIGNAEDSRGLLY
jgi:hypothetical protein